MVQKVVQDRAGKKTDKERRTEEKWGRKGKRIGREKKGENTKKREEEEKVKVVGNEGKGGVEINEMKQESKSKR